MRTPRRWERPESNDPAALANLPPGHLSNPNIAASGVTLDDYLGQIAAALNVPHETAAEVAKTTGVAWCIQLRDEITAAHQGIQ